MSNNDGEFTTSVELMVRPSSSSLRDTRDQIEAELNDITVDVAASGSGASGSSRTADMLASQSQGIQSTADMVDSLDERAEYRNELLEDILDEVETSGFTMGRRGSMTALPLGGGGAGLLGRLAPILASSGAGVALNAGAQQVIQRDQTGLLSDARALQKRGHPGPGDPPALELFTVSGMMQVVSGGVLKSGQALLDQLDSGFADLSWPSTEPPLNRLEAGFNDLSWPSFPRPPQWVGEVFGDVSLNNPGGGRRPGPGPPGSTTGGDGTALTFADRELRVAAERRWQDLAFTPADRKLLRAQQQMAFTPADRNLRRAANRLDRENQARTRARDRTEITINQTFEVNGVSRTQLEREMDKAKQDAVSEVEQKLSRLNRQGRL